MQCSGRGCGLWRDVESLIKNLIFYADKIQGAAFYPSEEKEGMLAGWLADDHLNEFLSD